MKKSKEKKKKSGADKKSKGSGEKSKGSHGNTRGTGADRKGPEQHHGGDKKGVERENLVHQGRPTGGPGGTGEYPKRGVSPVDGGDLRQGEDVLSAAGPSQGENSEKPGGEENEGRARNVSREARSGGKTSRKPDQGGAVPEWPIEGSAAPRSQLEGGAAPREPFEGGAASRGTIKTGAASRGRFERDAASGRPEQGGGERRRVDESFVRGEAEKEDGTVLHSFFKL